MISQSNFNMVFIFAFLDIGSIFISATRRIAKGVNAKKLVHCNLFSDGDEWIWC